MGWLWCISGGDGDLWCVVCHDKCAAVSGDATAVLAGAGAVARRDGCVGVGNVDVDAPRHAQVDALYGHRRQRGQHPLSAPLGGLSADKHLCGYARIGKTHKKITIKKATPRKGRSLMNIKGFIDCLLCERCSNVNGASHCAAYHWVVTHAEEAHHLNVSRY